MTYPQELAESLLAQCRRSLARTERTQPDTSTTLTVSSLRLTIRDKPPKDSTYDSAVAMTDNEFAAH